MNDANTLAALERLIDLYCEAWNESDAVHREMILRQVWAEDATYTDPRGHVKGIQELGNYIGWVQSSRPGAKVIRTSAVDSHHRLVRFAWRVMEADGTMLPEGIDFAELSGDGKLRRIVGFFGPLASKEQASAQALMTVGASMS